MVELNYHRRNFYAQKLQTHQRIRERNLATEKQGLTKREIGSKLGFSKEQIHNFISRYNENQRRVSAGIALKRKGRPPKDYIVREEDKIAELKYILARKEAKIKSLEMENDLMRDFLSLTERK